MNTIPNKEAISAAILQFVKSNVVAPGIELNVETELAALGIDSFSLIEIVLFIERQFGVVLQEDVLIPENLKTISSIAACAEKLLNE